MRIIPAIDIMDGKCVRLSKGDFNTKKVYSDDPLFVAKRFQDIGIEYLHLVDLDGAKSEHIVNYKVLENICAQTDLKVDFGGGLKTDQDLNIAFDCGAHQVTGGSIAVKNAQTFKAWISKYGANRIILGADCNHRKIATSGWMESSDLDVIDFIKGYEQDGVRYVICTDIAKDGMLGGTSNGLYKEIIEATNVNLIASGGVSNIEDLEKLKEIGCEGVIIGKAIYEERITLTQLRDIC